MDDNVIKILLLTDFSSGYSRDLLRGIVKYAQDRKNWAFYRMPMYFRMMHGDKAIIKWAKKWNVNAIIAQMNDINVEKLRELNIPIIVQNYGDRIPGICNLTGDYIGTGEMAAEYFIGLGYKNFAYYGISETIWSRERFIGYRDRLSRAGYSVMTFFEHISNREAWMQNFDDIRKWLTSLPDSTAIFVCDDYYALHLSETCKLYGIPVPDKLVILGVDNDEMMCNISSPPLSSIVIDAKNGGYMAGQVIEELIRNKAKEPFNIIVQPLQVISRGSTRKYVIQDKYVMRVVEYIETNYMNPLTIPELLELVPISRRVFEKRFRQETGTSIYQFLLKYRTDRMAELLQTSKRSIEDIAISCGFNDSRNISRIFSTHKGMTPSEFRKHLRNGVEINGTIDNESH